MKTNPSVNSVQFSKQKPSRYFLRGHGKPLNSTSTQSVLAMFHATSSVRGWKDSESPGDRVAETLGSGPGSATNLAHMDLRIFECKIRGLV